MVNKALGPLEIPWASGQWGFRPQAPWSLRAQRDRGRPKGGVRHLFLVAVLGLAAGPAQALDPNYRIDWKALRQQMLREGEQALKTSQLRLDAFQAVKQAAASGHIPLVIYEYPGHSINGVPQYEMVHGIRNGRITFRPLELSMSLTAQNLRAELVKYGEEWRVLLSALDNQVLMDIIKSQGRLFPVSVSKISLAAHRDPSGAEVKWIGHLSSAPLSLVVGDVITRVEAVPVVDVPSFFEAIRPYPDGASVKLAVVRRQEGAETRLSAMLPVSVARFDGWLNALAQSTLNVRMFTWVERRVVEGKKNLEKLRGMTDEEFIKTNRPVFVFRPPPPGALSELSDPDMAKKVSPEFLALMAHVVGHVTLPAFDDFADDLPLCGTRKETLLMMEEMEKLMNNQQDNPREKMPDRQKQGFQIVYSWIASLVDEEFLQLVEEAKQKAEQEAMNPRVERPRSPQAWVGLTLAMENPIPKVKGAILVSEVAKDGPAAKAGLKPGDRLVALEQRPVVDQASFDQAIQAYGPGAQVKIRYLRDGRETTVTLLIEKNPAPIR